MTSNVFPLIALIAALGLAGCNSPDQPTTTTAANITAEPSASTDPRVTQIRELHQQLLALKEPFAETEKHPIIAKNKNTPKWHNEFTKLIASSDEIQGTINQLDPANHQQPEQVKLIGESLSKEKKMLELANFLLDENKKTIKEQSAPN